MYLLRYFSCVFENHEIFFMEKDTSINVGGTICMIFNQRQLLWSTVLIIYTLLTKNKKSLKFKKCKSKFTNWFLKFHFNLHFILLVPQKLTKLTLQTYENLFLLPQCLILLLILIFSSWDYINFPMSNGKLTMIKLCVFKPVFLYRAIIN